MDVINQGFYNRCKGGTVIIVGTHLDKLRENASKDEETNEENEIKKRFDMVKEILRMSEVECIAIDNTKSDDEDMHVLRNRILELGLGVIDEEIPAQWIDLDRLVAERTQSGNVLMSFADLCLLHDSMDEPMRYHTRLKAFLGHQHNRGHLIYYLQDGLEDLIILEPDVLAMFLNNLMRGPDKKERTNMSQQVTCYNHNGLINENYVIEATKQMSDYPGLVDNAHKLLNMLVHLSVIHPYKLDMNVMKFLVPCLLPHRATEQRASTYAMQTHRFQIVFLNNHMPPPFYHILVGGLLNEWKLIEQEIGKPEIYHLFACFLLDWETQQMEIYWKDSCVYIHIKNYSAKNELQNSRVFEILEIIKTKIVKIFLVYRHTNTTFEIKVQCPEHEDTYVSIATLKKQREAMCYGKCPHVIYFEDVFGKHPLRKVRY